MTTLLLTENLKRSAERHPLRCAIKDGDRTSTYAELWHAACAIASGLVAHGFRPGDRAALTLPNSIEYVQALYGILLAGGIAVPLNPAAKQQDFASWLEHSEPSAIFTRSDISELAHALTQSGRTPLLIQLDEPAALFDAFLRADLRRAPSPLEWAQPAMIVYTSGTTGRPKGVTLSHGNVASNTTQIIESLRLQDADSIVNVLPFCFAYGNSVLHTHLKVGGCVIIERNCAYPHLVAERLQNERATGFAGVPSTYALLLSRLNLASYDLSSLRYVSQAGGAMTTAAIGRLREALPHAQLFVMYGQTEASARITCLPPEHLDTKLGSVGLPLPGIEVQIRAENGAIAPPGQDGEVWVNGPSVMLGYWRDRESTNDVLRGGWLRTGDLGRLDESGFLLLQGRRSDIIKVGGMRVHPNDIEEAIAELRGVREVAAVGVDDELLGQSVRVFVVLNDKARLSPLQIQAHCKSRLASYKVPKCVVMLASLPKTPSGKVQRFELARRRSA